MATMMTGGILGLNGHQTAEHFCFNDHDFLSHASVCCLEHNAKWSDHTRTFHESYWIRRLKTRAPFGINKGD